MSDLNDVFNKVMSDAEKKSWQEEERVRYTVVLTYARGGAYFCFRLNDAEKSKEYPRGISIKDIREIIDSLPKRLKPIDGLRRGWSVTVRKETVKSQRIK